MNIIWRPTPNCSAGRNGRAIAAIVNHITAGLVSGALAWLCNPAAQASAHYLISRTGDIYQLVREADRAWHAGIVKNPNWALYDGTNPNNYTIGIEHENISGGDLTELQYQATLWLHKQILDKYNIPADTEHIIGHYRIDSVNRPNCPGPNFPWARLFADLTQPYVNIRIGDKTVHGIVVQDSTGERSYAPIRVITGILGVSYVWDGPSSTVTIGDHRVPVVIRDDVGYAKVTELVAAVGRTYTWDEGTRTVTII